MPSTGGMSARHSFNASLNTMKIEETIHIIH